MQLLSWAPCDENEDQGVPCVETQTQQSQWVRVALSQKHQRLLFNSSRLPQASAYRPRSVVSDAPRTDLDLCSALHYPAFLVPSAELRWTSAGQGDPQASGAGKRRGEADQRLCLGIHIAPQPVSEENPVHS